MLVFTLLATWIGSGSLFGGAGLGYRAGFPALWQSAGAWTGIALVYFLAHRVRRIAKYTMADILELRYGPAARVLGTIVVVIAYTTIAAYQFRGGGRLLNLVAPGIDVTQGALITMAFCVAYTALAGMLSIAYLDVGNGVAMIVGVGAAVVYLIVHAGGVGPAFAALRPDQVRALRHARPDCRRRRVVSADDAAADGRGEHVSEVLLGQGRARRTRVRHRLDCRDHRRRDVDRRRRRVWQRCRSPGCRRAIRKRS